MVIESTRSKTPDTLKQLITGRRGHKWKIHHRNGDFLECRRENLEVVTQEESSRGNCKIEKRNGMPTTSPYKGVCWCEERGKWLAQINCGGVGYYLGRFDEETAPAPDRGLRGCRRRCTGRSLCTGWSLASRGRKTWSSI